MNVKLGPGLRRDDNALPVHETCIHFAVSSPPEPIIGKLTTHVLDTVHGRPASGMQVTLTRVDGEPAEIVTLTLNDDGRASSPLLEGAALVAGRYRLLFSVADYFAACGTELPDPPFLDRVPVEFGIADATANYHVPLLVSPWSYSTYRGS